MTERTEKQIDHCMRLMGLHPPGPLEIRERLRQGWALYQVQKEFGY